MNHLLTNLWSELQESSFWWQLAVIAVCFLVSYALCRALRKAFPAERHASEADAVASRKFADIFFPGLLLIFLCIGKATLMNFQRIDVLSFLIVVYGALTLMRFGQFTSRRIFAGKRQIGPTHLFIENVFAWGVWLLAVLYYTGLTQHILTFLDTQQIPIGRNDLSLLEISKALISVVVTVVLALLASAALERRLMKVDTVHVSLRLMLSRLGRSLLILFAILISLNLVGIDLTVLSVFGGALGVGLGLGLQKIASNYVSGFIILFDRSVALDDMITVDKYSGRVGKINTRYTVLKGLDGVQSIIPNEMLISSPVQNSSSDAQGVAVPIDLTVGYNTDIDALIPDLIDTISKVEGVSQNSVPAANLMKLGANGLDLTIWFRVIRLEDKGGTISKVNRAIWKLLQEKKIEVPYPQTEVRLLNPAELNSSKPLSRPKTDV